MADRSDKKQSLHNRAVEEVADEFSSPDVTVKADHISKYDQPDELNNEIPDILVIDEGSKRAFEIETDSTDDKTQHHPF